jgi:hypothetical protein
MGVDWWWFPHVLSSNVLIWFKNPMVLSTLKSNIRIEENGRIHAPEVV